MNDLAFRFGPTASCVGTLERSFLPQIGQVVHPSDSRVTVYRYSYDTHQPLGEHLKTFLMASNFANRLKLLKGLTPYEYLCQQWQQPPELFLSDPSHLTLGLDTLDHNLKELLKAL